MSVDILSLVVLNTSALISLVLILTLIIHYLKHRDKLSLLTQFNVLFTLGTAGWGLGSILDWVKPEFTNLVETKLIGLISVILTVLTFFAYTKLILLRTEVAIRVIMPEKLKLLRRVSFLLPLLLIIPIIISIEELVVAILVNTTYTLSNEIKSYYFAAIGLIILTLDLFAGIIFYKTYKQTKETRIIIVCKYGITCVSFTIITNGLYIAYVVTNNWVYYLCMRVLGNCIFGVLVGMKWKLVEGDEEGDDGVDGDVLSSIERDTSKFRRKVTVRDTMNVQEVR